MSSSKRIKIKTQMARLFKMSPEEHIAEIDRALDYIVDHPETWNQTNWVCRTGMCIAGVGGYFSPFVFAKRENVESAGTDDLVDMYGDTVGIAEYAHALFGLAGPYNTNFEVDADGITTGEFSEAYLLFNSDNTLRDLFHARNIIANRRGIRKRKIPWNKISDSQQIADAVNTARRVFKPGYEGLDDWPTYGGKRRYPGMSIRQHREFWLEIERQERIFAAKNFVEIPE